MKFLKITAAILFVIAVCITFFFWNSGAFSSITIQEETKGPYYVVGIERKGDYKESGIYMDNVYETLLAIDVKTERGFGIYWDNPEVVPPEECKSLVGCIINAKDTIYNRKFARQGLVFQKVGVTKYVTAEFPFKNMASMISGIIRVYPMLREYLNEKKLKGGPAMEIYDQKNEKMYFMMTISN